MPTHEPDPTALKRPRLVSSHRLWIVGLGLTVVAAILVGMIGKRWSVAELQLVEREIKGGQVSAARARLTRLAQLRLGGTEVKYWVGACEEADGHIEKALSAWAQIPKDSSRFPNATLRRARLALAHGRISVAEDALTHVNFPAGSPAFEIREHELQQIDFLTGQTDDLRKRIQRGWERATNQAEILRRHWLLDEIRAYPVGALRSRLEEAEREAPDDDRVWLGRADLAIHTAQFAEADEWLKKCVSRRPEDPVIWRRRLEWAMGSDRLTEATEAARHLPSEQVEPERLLWFRAWLAAHRGDDQAERSALTWLLECDSGDTKAVARLTELAARAGQKEQVAGLRNRKTELDQAIEAYRTLLNAGVPTANFDRLGRLAEALSRWFEARGWWTLAGRDSTHAELARATLARLDQIKREIDSAHEKVLTEYLTSRTAAAPKRQTVADALTDLIPRDLAGSAPATIVPTFRDDAHGVGLDFTYENDPTPSCRMPETMGGGIALLDYDGDGWLDVYAVQGGRLSNDSPPAAAAQRDRLYRNKGDGTFEDVTTAAGLATMAGGYGHGVAVGDFDNDGHPDLFVTRWRSYALYHNRADGKFLDVTALAGLGGNRDWPTSAAFADLDGDGDLDLYVCHYSGWDPQQSTPCPHPSKPDTYSYCGPRVFAAMPDHVFRNDSGHFVDVSSESGVRAADSEGRGLGVLAADLDDDGRIDLFVANDLTANFLFRNQGHFEFQESAAESGVATNSEGGYLAGMGIACGDMDGDGRFDLAVTNFFAESTTFYRNLGAGQFVDHSVAIGLAAPSRFLLGFGAAFFDANNDSRLDLATANGHVNDLRPHVPYAMPAQLLLGNASRRLTDVTRHAGAPWQQPRLGRGLATGDLDNDGRIDLLIVAEGEPLAYFHNQGPAGHFVTLQLEGASPGSNRDAVGACVTLTTDRCRQVAQRVGGGSFLSASDGRLHFGLGDAKVIESALVRWPSGHVDRYTGMKVDAAYLLKEGQTKVNLLRGWRAQP